MPAAKPGGKKELYNPMQEWGDMFTDAQGLEDYEETGNPYRVQPVDIQTFVTSKDYLGVNDYGGLSPRQLELTEQATDMENGIEFIVALAGKNSGKNFTCAVIFLYATYKMLCMYDCHKYLGIPRISMLTLINVSINEKQARKTFFDPLITILKNAGDMAFKQFDWKPIDGVTILTDEIKFPKHNIQLLSMNSKAGASEGYNLVLGMADEIDAVEFISVDNIVKTLRTSSNTRFSGGKGKTPSGSLDGSNCGY